MLYILQTFAHKYCSMRKLLLFAGCLLSVHCVQAQYYPLSGTDYNQNFDSLTAIAGTAIPNALPTGWHLYTGAADTLGSKLIDTTVAFGRYYGQVPSYTIWNKTSGNFRNVASLNGITSGADYAAMFSDTTSQNNKTDRALAVRQVSGTSSSFPGTDPGASFDFAIANTLGYTDFNLTFKLQSLDSSSPRTALWQVQYGFGANPSGFSNATIVSGDTATGGSMWSNNTITVSFGSALDNNAGPVWIRIVTLDATTGSGNRPTTAIDDFHLTWTGSGDMRPSIIATSPANNATGVDPASPLSITFSRVISKGSGNIYIKSETDGSLITKAVTSSSVTVSGNTATIAGLSLMNNTTYHVTFDSAAFDTASYKSYGLYDTTAWKFTTMPSGIQNVHANTLPLTIINPVTNGELSFQITTKEAGAYNVNIYDLAGRQLAYKTMIMAAGAQRLKITGLQFPVGMYVFRVSHNTDVSAAKFVVQ